MSLVNINGVTVQWNGILTTTGSNVVTSEIPNGVINGVNSIFTTDFSFIPESVEIFVNGLQVTNGTDYYTTGTNTITFNYSLAVGDILRVNYIKE